MTKEREERIKKFRATVLAKRGSLGSNYPAIAKQWHPTKNGDITPFDVTDHTGEKYWWLCEVCGNEWQSSVAHRTDGRGCPACSKRAAAKLYQNRAAKTNSLAHNIDKYPWIAEWSERNAPLTIDKVALNTHRKMWWKCAKCGHEFLQAPHTKARGCGCPQCFGSYQTSEPEQVFAFYLKQCVHDIQTGYHDSEWDNQYNIDIYSPSLKLAIEYDGALTHKESQYDIPKGEFLQSIGVTLLRIREPGCPILNDGSVHFSCAKCNIDLTPVANTLQEVLVWLENHQYITSIPSVDLYRDYNAILEPLRYKKEQKSIPVTHPEIMKDWDYERNTLDPTLVNHQSNMSAWWKCSKCGAVFQKNIHTYVKCHSCPSCSVRGKPCAKYDKDGNILSQYPSMKIAAQAEGVSHQTMYDWCKSQKRSANGQYWAQITHNPTSD